jgi:integrase
MPEDFAELPFTTAFDKWFKAHKPFVAESTQQDYYQYGRALCAFFQEMPLRMILSGAVRAFQMWRWKRGEVRPDDPQCIYTHNAETVRIKNEICGVLKPMLREAGTWPEIVKRKFKHLPVPREGSGEALSLEEQRIVLKVGFSRKRWLLAAHCQRVMYRTGSGFGELRKLRRRDVDLARATITIINGAKNAGARVRTVTLTASALESMKWIVARWERLGGSDPEQYVLPHRTKGLGHPMVSTYCAWCAIVEEAIRQNPHLKDKLERTRQYDARPSAATILMKNEKLSLPVIEKALGWTPNSLMRKRYNRAEHQVLRQAMDTLEDAG